MDKRPFIVRLDSAMDGGREGALLILRIIRLENMFVERVAIPCLSFKDLRPRRLQNITASEEDRYLPEIL